MRILFLTRLYYPHIGGVEKHTMEVAKRLIEKGHRIIVITEALPQNFKFQMTNDKSISNDKFQIYRISVGKDNRLKKFQIWWWLFKNRTLINRSDIIHAHDVAFWYFPFRFLYPKKPFFVTFHGWEGKYPIPFKNKIIRKISEKLALGNICVGDYLAKWYGTKPSDVTYGGVEKVQSSKFKVQSYSSKFKVIFIGRLSKDTGLPIYLKAMKRLRVGFLGDGPLRKNAEKFGKIYGFVRDIKSYVLQSRFVFTSGYLAILEAMICKRLVFAVYDNPLKKDYLEMALFSKWIVIEKNPKKLAEKIEYYRHHPEEEKELIDRAYNWVKEQTWEKVTDIYLKLWGKSKK